MEGTWEGLEGKGGNNVNTICICEILKSYPKKPLKATSPPHSPKIVKSKGLENTVFSGRKKFWRILCKELGE